LEKQMRAWLTALFVLSLFPLTQAVAGDSEENWQQVDSYRALLSVQDRRSSNGSLLTDAVAIIRQDRANHHVFSRKDSDDQHDKMFGNKEKRAWLQTTLMKSLDEKTRKEIETTTVLVEVSTWRDRKDQDVRVKVLEKRGIVTVIGEDILVEHTMTEWGSDFGNLIVRLNGKEVLNVDIRMYDFELDPKSGRLVFSTGVYASNPIFGQGCSWQAVKLPTEGYKEWMGTSGIEVPKRCWEHVQKKYPSLKGVAPKQCSCTGGLDVAIKAQFELDLSKLPTEPPRFTGKFGCDCIS